MKHRLELISDGVFAIAMTLLVLELKVAEVPKTASSEEVWESLFHLGPLFVAYLTTFVLTSVFWLRHTRLFKPLPQELDMPFFILNTVMLMAMSLLPLTLSLFEKWRIRPETMQMFLLHFSLIAGVVGAQAIYVWRRNWWPADHPKNELIGMSYVLPAIAIGGVLGAILAPYAPGAIALPILCCAAIGRKLSSRRIAR